MLIHRFQQAVDMLVLAIVEVAQVLAATCRATVRELGDVLLRLQLGLEEERVAVGGSAAECLGEEIA